MFFRLILENANGDRVDMTATANQYMTSRVEGLNPPTGTISTSSYAGMDGSYLNNAFIEKRNVIISFEMRGVGVEARRHQLYKVVKLSRYIKINYATAGIDVFAEGYQHEHKEYFPWYRYICHFRPFVFPSYPVFSVADMVFTDYESLVAFADSSFLPLTFCSF